MAKHQYFDISLPLTITKAIPTLPPAPPAPGKAPLKNPVPRVYRFFDVGKGDPVTMSAIEISSHDGTHIDAPLHFIPGGMTIDAMPIETTNGPCRVIEIKDDKDITVAELEPYKIKAGERIIFKTKNSPRVYAVAQYTGQYVAVTLEAAEYLVAKKIRLVGLDYLTIAHQQPPENINNVHKTFLNNGVFILEAVNLDGVKPGKYDLMGLTLRLENGDAGPCRVILRK